MATELRKRQMEERIARVREKERREKLAAKKSLGRPRKRQVLATIATTAELMKERHRNTDRKGIPSGRLQF